MSVSTRAVSTCVVSTHVLDTATGVPAAGVGVALYSGQDVPVEQGVTDGDGRHRFSALPGPGTYRLRFDTGAYFAATGRASLYPFVDVTFDITASGKLHVPLLLSPFGYSTYQGS
jgi:5-hydroxyisourate hydrolase